MDTIIITDNLEAAKIAIELSEKYGGISIFQSSHGQISDMPRIDLVRDFDLIKDNCALVMSLHCKQIFPESLTSKVRCINIHPGYNPLNRGWYPHIFSIVNGLDTGVTIHEMTSEIDNGAIIVQEKCKVEPWDTGQSLYEKIISLERKLLNELFPLLRDGLYEAYTCKESGNINYRKDFEKLRALNMDDVDSLKSIINKLRALSHDNYNNAYFFDPEGRKIFVKLQLTKEDI